MILVGQYDSPPTRRVAISLSVLGFVFEHDARSIFGDFDALRAINPLGRIPSLVLDDGTALIDSAAILDWIDQEVGPERALMPPHGPARRIAMQTVALALGAVEKIGAAAYERLMRPPQYRWPEWIARCRTQGAGALPVLERVQWSERLDQAQITTACMVNYLRTVDPEIIPRGRYPALDALTDRCEERPEFANTRVDGYALPRGKLGG
ncbi:MAG: glutathione S-transferase family protein [Rhizomicrobium sp.]|jgi:glutathione S-transferase